MTDHNKLVEALKEMCDPPIPGSDVELLRKVIQKLPIEGGDVDIEALPVTKNGVYTAEEGKAYSPVTVNVSTNPKTITLMRSQITSLDPYEFLLTQEQFDVISSNTEIIIDATDLGIGSIRCFVAADSDGDTYSGSSLIPYGGSSGISSIRLATYLADSSTLKLFVRFQDVNHPDADIATITDVESVTGEKINLSTSDKTNLVAAINENVGRIAALEGQASSSGRILTELDIVEDLVKLSPVANHSDLLEGYINHECRIDKAFYGSESCRFKVSLFNMLRHYDSDEHQPIEIVCDNLDTKQIDPDAEYSNTYIGASKSGDGDYDFDFTESMPFVIIGEYGVNQKIILKKSVYEAFVDALYTDAESPLDTVCVKIKVKNAHYDLAWNSWSQSFVQNEAAGNIKMFGLYDDIEYIESLEMHGYHLNCRKAGELRFTPIDGFNIINHLYRSADIANNLIYSRGVYGRSHASAVISEYNTGEWRFYQFSKSNLYGDSETPDDTIDSVEWDGDTTGLTQINAINFPTYAPTLYKISDHAITCREQATKIQITLSDGTVSQPEDVDAVISNNCSFAVLGISENLVPGMDFPVVVSTTKPGWIPLLPTTDGILYKVEDEGTYVWKEEGKPYITKIETVTEGGGT